MRLPGRQKHGYYAIPCQVFRRNHDQEQTGATQLRVNAKVLRIPFCELQRKATDLDPETSYMLYCGKGVISRLHAGHLHEEGRLDVKVYAP